MTAIWTCPFCPLLCDDLPAPSGLDALATWPCARVRERSALLCAASSTSATFSTDSCSARVEGQPVPLATALQRSRQWWQQSRQPLLAGWSTEVAGARALTRLAERVGAITDAVGGDALTQALRVQQDRGGYSTTLAEVRQHADMVVVVGPWPAVRWPRLFERLLAGRADNLPSVVHWGEPDDITAQTPSFEVSVVGRVAVEPWAVSPGQDMFDAVAQVLQHLPLTAPQKPPKPQDLSPLAPVDFNPRRSGGTAHGADWAQRLRAARYVTLVWEPAQSGPQAALLIEQLQSLITRLNLSTRAAGLSLGGADGGGTAQHVVTWMTGLPLRSRAGPWGREHEPLRWSTTRLLDQGAVDLLCWVGSFPGVALPRPGQPTQTGAEAGASTSPLRRIVLGTADTVLDDERDTVFIPVLTPGVHQGGHLFRSDGIVMLPLHAVPGAAAQAVTPTGEAWPSVAQVVEHWLAEAGSQEVCG